MKTYTPFALLCLALLKPSLFCQTNAPVESTSAVTTPPPIPEAARRHFVMGTTLFKDAKTVDDYSQVEDEFKQAADLAPQWPEARYNLALVREAAGDYVGAMSDLKRYQQFKLSDTEARTVQDKIYALEAKAGVAAKKQADEEKAQQARTAAAAGEQKRQARQVFDRLNGGIWQSDDDRWGSRDAIKIVDNVFQIYFRAGKYGSNADLNGTFDKDLGYNYYYTLEPVNLAIKLHNRQFDASFENIKVDGPIHFTISEDNQTITQQQPGVARDGAPAMTKIYKRVK